MDVSEAYNTLFGSKGTNIAETAQNARKQPLRTLEDVPLLLERKQANVQADKDAYTAVCTEYQEAVRKSESIRTRILQEWGKTDTDTLLVMACEVISLMTGDEVFYLMCREQYNKTHPQGEYGNADTPF